MDDPLLNLEHAALDGLAADIVIRYPPELKAALAPAQVGPK